MAIGNELLSGKTRDANMYYLASELRALGVALTLTLFVRDETQEIVDAIHYARSRAEVVLTTGGVGPTHDDITLGAVARAFDTDLVRNPRIAEAIHAHYGDDVNDDLLSMADVPRGAELIQPAPFFLPIFRMENVFVFPGDPGALQLLFEGWKETLRRTPYSLARFELDADEGQVAPLLRSVQDDRPELQLGSYPRFDAQAPYRVLVTVEGKDPAQVSAAAEHLEQRFLEELGAAALLRTVLPDGKP